MHKRLFIPGPTEVAPEVRERLSMPPVGHRSEEATELGTLHAEASRLTSRIVITGYGPLFCDDAIEMSRLAPWPGRVPARYVPPPAGQDVSSVRTR